LRNYSVIVTLGRKNQPLNLYISGPGHLKLELAINTHDTARLHLGGNNTYTGGTTILGSAMDEFAGSSDGIILDVTSTGAFGTADVLADARKGGLMERMCRCNDPQTGRRARPARLR
jgi:hypothetical protein